MSGTSETFWRLSSLDPLVCPQGTGPWTLCSSACLRLIWTWTTWTWTEMGTLPIRPSAQRDGVLTYSWQAVAMATSRNVCFLFLLLQ